MEGKEWKPESEAMDRREFLKGAAAMFGAALLAGNAAEAASLLEKAANPEEEAEKGPRISFEFFFSAHLTGADKRGGMEKMRGADIFAPESIGMDEELRARFQDVADGKLTPSEVAKNYGWPDIEGGKTQAGMTTPVRHSGATDTWAPASLVYLNGSLFFGGLRGEALYEAVLDGTRVAELKEHFKNEFGRIRTVRVGPDGMLYLTTSNTDGRGSPAAGDDKIIRVNPSLL